MTTDRVQLRRLNDLGKPYRGIWLYPAPAYLRYMAESGHANRALIENHLLSSALRVRAGRTLCSEGAGVCVVCHKQVANIDEHAMACMTGGHRSHSHNEMVNCVSSVIADFGFPVRTEKQLFANKERLDLVTHVDGVRYALDVTIVSPLIATTNVPAVKKAAANKCTKYEEDCREIGYRFIPAAFDMWGNRCEEFEGFIRQLDLASSRIAPHLNHPTIAIQTRIQMCLARAVGALLTAKLGGAHEALQ